MMVRMKHFETRILIVILLLAGLLSLAYATDVQIIQVDALSTKTLIFNLKNGQRFSGSLAISGGSGNDIDFWVTDPMGATIVNLGRVSQGRSFEFTVNKDGAYTFHFSNTFSLFSSKTVSLTFDVKAPLVFGLEPDVFIIGIILIAFLVGALIVIAYRQGRKTRQETIHPTD